MFGLDLELQEIWRAKSIMGSSYKQV